ncbi:MAG TPA: discoidin domain-containing protein, partial [Gammaproteobacteria bacterium]|nr:discoidin domain-containing protein [Gammaproteobacteria bacterium]
TSVFTHVTLSVGNKAVWSEAPEDVEAAIDEAKLTAEQAQLAADGYMRARYIRDWAQGNSTNSWNQWHEIEVINKDGTNIALGKIPTSNGTFAANQPASNATDGDRGTYAGINNTPPQLNYARIDLGQIYHDIDYIVIKRSYQDGRTYHNTKTEISEDGVNWTTIFDSAVEGTYAETAEGKIHTQRYASVMNRLAETEAKTRFQTLIDGGLIYTALMKLFDTISGDETAFISGKQGAGKNLPAFGAGGSYQDAVAGTAKAIIRHDGSAKFSDAEISGIINAIGGTIGGLSLEGKKLFSQNHKLQIDGEEATIALLDPNTDALRTIIRPTNITTSVASYFASSSISPASIATIKTNYTKTIWNLASSSITLNATGGKTFEVSIPAFSVTMGVTHPGGAGIGSVYARMAVYLTNGSSMKQPLTSLASIITSTGGTFSKTDDYPAQKVVVTNSGNYYLRVELTHSPEAVSPNGQFSSTATSFTASEVVNRSEIGSNGMVIATSDTNYTFMVGNTFEVRRGNSGLRITNAGIEKFNGTSWVTANI